MRPVDRRTPTSRSIRATSARSIRIRCYARCAPYRQGFETADFSRARGGIRTHTPLRATDFESAVSTVPPLGPGAAGYRRARPVESEPMATTILQRRLVDVSERLKRLRAELLVTEEQVAFLDGEAEEFRLRALMSETP